MKQIYFLGNGAVATMVRATSRRVMNQGLAIHFFILLPPFMQIAPFTIYLVLPIPYSKKYAKDNSLFYLGFSRALSPFPSIF
jgi:hypothetical protein